MTTHRSGPVAPFPGWRTMTDQEAREALAATTAVWNVLAFLSGWSVR